MQLPVEWSTLRRDTALGLDLLQARFTTYAFARHWHDYYVISLVEAGAQSFRCQRKTYLTPPGRRPLRMWPTPRDLAARAI
jgi:hypothetical protein